MIFPRRIYDLGLSHKAVAVYCYLANRADINGEWFCQYHLTHFIRTRIMQRERYDHSRAFFELPEAVRRWRCRFFCWPSNSYNISRS